jgi:hypothetical protein
VSGSTSTSQGRSAESEARPRGTPCQTITRLSAPDHARPRFEEFDLGSISPTSEGEVDYVVLVRIWRVEVRY